MAVFLSYTWSLLKDAGWLGTLALVIAATLTLSSLAAKLAYRGIGHHGRPNESGNPL